MKPIIFFDDGGVLNNDQIRGSQYQPLIAEYMAENFGGDAKVWKDANYEAVIKIMNLISAKTSSGQLLSYNDFKKEENEIWIETMFNRAGIDLPPKSKYLTINKEAEAYVLPKIKSMYPKISESIKKLYNEGFHLNTASAASSRFLRLSLERTGILHCFKTLYGSDLIETMKVSSHYYKNIFEKESLDPKNAIVIDDNVTMLNLARNLGAHVIQSCIVGKKPEFENFYYDAEFIPKIIGKITTNMVI